jgi:hypothetical protein
MAEDKGMKRVELQLSERAAARLSVLREKADASTNAEVLRNALRLYEEVVNRYEDGFELFLKDRKGAYIKLVVF